MECVSRCSTVAAFCPRDVHGLQALTGFTFIRQCHVSGYHFPWHAILFTKGDDRGSDLGDVEIGRATHAVDLETRAAQKSLPILGYRGCIGKPMLLIPAQMGTKRGIYRFYLQQWILKRILCVFRVHCTMEIPRVGRAFLTGVKS